MTLPWTVRAWPALLWQATQAKELRLFHLGTRLLSGPDEHSYGSGQTVWGASSVEGDAGLAWDWVQLMPGVVVLADPMSLVTNVRLLGSEGEVLTAWEAARHLNDIVHALPWQTEVQRALSAEAPAAWAAPRRRPAPHAIGCLH